VATYEPAVANVAANPSGEYTSTWMKNSLRPDIVVLGGINSDFLVRGKTLPEPGQSVLGTSFHSGAGGKGANQAVAAARLGARVAIIGRVGDETRGRELVRNLKREKVDCRLVSFDPKEPTGAAVISVDVKGEKQISAALGANHTLKVSQIREAESIIAAARVLLCNFEAPTGCVLAAARIARRHGVKVVLDPAPPQNVPKALFPLIYVIRPNSDEAEQMTGIPVSSRASARKAAKKLLALGVQVVALEAGHDGNLIVSEDGEFFLPRINVKAVDATGAGDAFAAGLAVGLGECLSLEAAAQLATVTAALATTKVGAQEGMPLRREVEAKLRKWRVQARD
jgi:ribokinase